MTNDYVYVAINSRLLLFCCADFMCSKMFRGFLTKVFSTDSGIQLFYYYNYNIGYDLNYNISVVICSKNIICLQVRRTRRLTL